VVSGPSATPLGLYVHIPFCVRKCHYCDFAAGPAPAAIREQYVETLVEQIRRSPWRGSPARTVFFGGGTPSELKTPELRRITEALRESFQMVPTEPPALTECEWTIECNPGTVTETSVAEMRELGFNRVSLGIQTFHDAHLRALGRIHDAAQAHEAYAAARRAGFQRLSVDLIFCLSDQTMAQWQSDVEEALALTPEHLSLYNLTIEKETEFGRRHRQGLIALPDEDLSADMYEWIIDRLAAAGYAQYEISNFALPGEECRHNQIYWRQEPFLGFGLGAASYWEGRRWTATRSMQGYLSSALETTGPETSTDELLSPREVCGEAIMLGLRTREGANLTALCEQYGVDEEAEFGAATRQLLADELLIRIGPQIRLTRRGLLLANGVCAEFL
jgi:oxygen-independent coproporphyrinogen-3 oxidase